MLAFQWCLLPHLHPDTDDFKFAAVKISKSTTQTALFNHCTAVPSQTSFLAAILPRKEVGLQI
jgi:hypothetical protein